MYNLKNQLFSLFLKINKRTIITTIDKKNSVEYFTNTFTINDCLSSNKIVF